MRFFRYIFFFTICLGLDRWTKLLALRNNVDLQVFPILNFSLIWNRGVSWGLFHGASEYGFYLLTLFIILVTIGLAYYTFYHQLYKNKANILLEILVLSGAVSNIVDRFVYGGVIDFIQFHVGSWYFPTFNIADIFVVCGVFGLLIKNIVRENED